MAQNDKKNKDETEKEHYTGTPEQQLPDLEGEEQQEQYEETARTGKEEESKDE